MSTKIIATIDNFGLTTFRNAEAIEGIGIKDEFNTFYDAGISEDFVVYASDVDENNSIIPSYLTYMETIPKWKVGQKVVLLVYYNDGYDSGTEINAIFDNWQSFEKSESYKDLNRMNYSFIFVPLNIVEIVGWNGVW